MLRFVLLTLLFWRIVGRIEVCSHGGVCPDLNTCCAMTNGSSGCIPNDLGAYNATCCSDLETGCAVGYTCGPRQQCLATETIKDPLVQVLPRYILCQAPKGTLVRVHGLEIAGVKDRKLAYYSTKGDLQLVQEFSNITIALVMVHGAGRNADDYFCSATAAAELQTVYDSSTVLVVAPRFLVPSDGPVRLTSGGTSLRWKDQGSGPWRYGAPAIAPTGVSSYDAMDQLVEELHNTTRFPKLKHVTLSGHSSGGQFVQRWSLLTSNWQRSPRIQMRAVVANPSSYAYLEEYRYQDGAWQIPSSSCPQYNQWEWGLESGGELDVPYKNRALEKIGNNVSRLAHRFANRNVYYLAGSLDRCNVTDPSGGWCNSHGLETSCMDELQGSNRWERNQHFFASLKRLGITTHQRLVVNGVGHDHSLIFTSPKGLSALFGSNGEGESRASSVS